MGCVLYLFDLLLQSHVRTPSKGNCETFWNMPLPCSGEVWTSTISTPHRTTRTQGHRLTLGDLLLLRRNPRLDGLAKLRRPTLITEIAEWCETADDLSTLLWMALSVEGEGQAPEPLK